MQVSDKLKLLGEEHLDPHRGGDEAHTDDAVELWRSEHDVEGVPPVIRRALRLRTSRRWLASISPAEAPHTILARGEGPTMAAALADAGQQMSAAALDAAAVTAMEVELAEHQAAVAAAIARGDIQTAIMRGRMLRGQAIAAWAERQRIDLWALALAAVIVAVTWAVHWE